MGMCKKCGEVYGAIDLKDGICPECRNDSEEVEIQPASTSTRTIDENIVYCKECGAKNPIKNVKCEECGTIIKSSNAPLDGTERIKIVSFFAILVLPFFCLGGSIPILLIVIGSIYIMKKDKDFSPILKAKQYIKYYLILLAIGGALTFPLVVYSESKTTYNTEHTSYSSKINTYAEAAIKSNPALEYRDRDELDIAIAKEYNLKEPPYWIDNPNLVRNTVLSLIISTLASFFTLIFLLWLFNILFFEPMQRHKKWIVKNGIFADAPKEQEAGNSIDIIGRDKLSTFSVADEFMKWNEMLEKGLISKEEFEDAKKKLLGKGE